MYHLLIEPCESYIIEHYYYRALIMIDHTNIEMADIYSIYYILHLTRWWFSKFIFLNNVHEHAIALRCHNLISTISYHFLYKIFTCIIINTKRFSFFSYRHSSCFVFKNKASLLLMQLSVKSRSLIQCYTKRANARLFCTSNTKFVLVFVSFITLNEC